MRILALLSDDVLRTVQRSIGAAHGIVREGTARGAAAAVSHRRCDVFVLDPAILGDEEFAELLPTLARSAVPVLLYTPLTAATARRVVQATELGAHELVLQGMEDDGELVARKLASLLEPSVPALLLNRAAPHLRAFPERLQTVSVGLFGSGALPRWVDELAVSSGLARRTVDRWTERAGIDGAAMLLDTARLARTWEPLVERRLPPRAVAVECGYARTRLFVSHMRRIARASPADLGRAVSREQFADRLATTLLAR